MIRTILSAISSNLFGRRRPTGVEIIFQIVFTLLLAGVFYDFFEAYYSLSCRDSVQPENIGCYPWGGTEGPIDSAWNYMSKEIYLKSSVVLILSILIMIAAPFFTRTPWHVPIALTIIYIFNTYAAAWVVGLF